MCIIYRVYDNHNDKEFIHLCREGKSGGISPSVTCVQILDDEAVPPLPSAQFADAPSEDEENLPKKYNVTKSCS